MPRIRLLLEYDGTDFHGWQLQAGDRTVQGELEAALVQIVGRPVRVQGAGRTDAGVHARGQVAHADVDTRLEPAELKRALNAVLPPDVAVLELAAASADFDARGDARWKRYIYRILERRPASPLRRRMVWHHHGALELAPMVDAARVLEGTHDFAAFRGNPRGSGDEGTVRTLLRLEPRREGDELWIVAEGQAFLRHMVRNLVGTLVEVGRGRLAPEAVSEILASRDRSRAGPTAPACGLCLDHIEYPDPGPVD
jgi:tRNA pseudouridine38-40 synthase